MYHLPQFIPIFSQHGTERKMIIGKHWETEIVPGQREPAGTFGPEPR